MNSALQSIALAFTFAAVAAWINHKFIRLPNTIGIMLLALLFSLTLVILGALGFPLLKEMATSTIAQLDFGEILMQGMLSFLLFAGALHVNFENLAKQKRVIGLMATLGIVLSTALIGSASWWVFDLLGFDVPFIYCLLFGALISPTDPIAVLGILKQAGVAKSLETKITGESLFNDGVGVVIFLVLLGIATSGKDITLGNVALVFAEEAIGGALFGLFIGWITFLMLKSLDDYKVEVLLTLALVIGGYTFAQTIHVSGPIAVVVAGLLIGNMGRSLAMSDTTRSHLDSFWELLDEILNALLFVLIGLEMLIISLQGQYLLAGVLMIPLVLLARFVSVGFSVTLLRPFRSFSPHAVKLMTWGGLRGGISIALALSLPAFEGRDLLLTITYVIVVFSITVQGLTLGGLAKKLSAE